MEGQTNNLNYNSVENNFYEGPKWWYKYAAVGVILIIVLVVVLIKDAAKKNRKKKTGVSEPLPTPTEMKDQLSKKIVKSKEIINNEVEKLNKEFDIELTPEWTTQLLNETVEQMTPPPSSKCIKPQPCDGKEWEDDPNKPGCCRPKTLTADQAQMQVVKQMAIEYGAGEALEYGIKKLAPKLLRKGATGIARMLGTEMSKNIAKEAMQKALEKMLKELIAKLSAKLASRMAAKLALKMVKMAGMLASGPAGWALQTIDMIGMITDILDPLGFENFVWYKDFVGVRNTIIMSAQEARTEDGGRWPQLYPLMFVYPEVFADSMVMQINEFALEMEEGLYADGSLLMIYLDENDPDDEEFNAWFDTPEVAIWQTDLINGIMNSPGNYKRRDKVFLDYFNGNYPGDFKLYEGFSTPEDVGVSLSESRAAKFWTWQHKKLIDDAFTCFGLDCEAQDEGASLMVEGMEEGTDEQRGLLISASMIASPPIWSDQYYGVDIDNPSKTVGGWAAAKQTNLNIIAKPNPGGEFAPLFYPSVGMLLDMCEGTAWPRAQWGLLLEMITMLPGMVAGLANKGLKFITPNFIEDALVASMDFYGITAASNYLQADFKALQKSFAEETGWTMDKMKKKLAHRTGDTYSGGNLCTGPCNYFNEFNQRTMTCNYSSDYCDHMGLQRYTVADDGTKSCKYYSVHQKNAETVFGPGIVRSYIITGNAINDWGDQAGTDIENAAKEVNRWTDQAAKDVARETKEAAKAAGKWTVGAAKDVARETKEAAKEVNRWTDQAAKDAARETKEAAEAAGKWTVGAGKTIGKGAVTAGKAVGGVASAGAKGVAKGATKAWKSLFSDTRLKTNLIMVQQDYVVPGIHLYLFTWNTIANDLYNLHGPQYGVITQDVEKVYPQIVFTDEYGYQVIIYDKNLYYTNNVYRTIFDLTTKNNL
jgi:hypothetical protein